MGECCVCFDEVARGVVCGTREGHFLCAVCAPREVQRVLQALQEPGPLQQFRARGGRIKCVVDGCEAPYRDELILPLLPPSTAQAYRCEQADAAEAPRAGNLQSEEAATAEFLKRHYRNAVQCPRCAAGPVIPEHCADLQAHHNQAMERGGRISNACPACGFFSANRADWVAWDGHMRGVSRTAAATNVSSAWAPASSGRMEGLSGEQQEKVTALMRVAAIEDVVFARDLLQEHNWQLETSVNTYFDRLQRNGPARPCPWTAKACLISLLVLALLLLLDAGTVLTFLGHLLAWVWNFSVDVTTWSVQTLKTACVLGGHLLAWVWNCWLSRWGGHLALCPAGTLGGKFWGCSPCGPGSWSDEGSTACSCNKGWTAAGVTGGSMCAKCPASTFKAVRGPSGCQACPRGSVSPEGSEAVSQCVSCPAGTFAGNSGSCEQCDPGSWSDEGSSACSCNKGWTAVGGTGVGMCTKCPPNTFKAVRGHSGCQACPRGLVSPEGSEAGRQCVPCPAGTFAGQAGSCEPCGVGSWSDEGSTACSCNKGWTAAGVTGASMCIKCPTNTFKAVRGHSGCQACPFGFASKEGSEELMECAPEGVISGLTGGVVLMLKGIGVLEEVPRERRWRQQMTSALPEHAHAHVSSALAHVSARVQDAMGDIYSRVTRAVLDLFASLSEFYGASARHEQADASVCSSEKTLKAWLVQQDEYNAWRQAVSAVRGGRGWNRAPECAQMKKSARRVLLILHPDKLQRIHPTCAQGRGALLAADFNAEYDTQKRLCAGR